MDQHRERGHAIARPVIAQQRTYRGGYDIRATAYRLGKDHFRTVLAEPLDRIDEIRKTTAEATAAHLVRGNAGAPREFRIDEVVALIVHHRSHAHAALLQNPRRF